MCSRTRVIVWELGAVGAPHLIRRPAVHDDVPIGSAEKVGMTTDCSTGPAGAWTAVVRAGDREQRLGFAAFPHPGNLVPTRCARILHSSIARPVENENTKYFNWLATLKVTLLAPKVFF
jgi:hypothetical protein